jgi:hypothetical protein
MAENGHDLLLRLQQEEIKQTSKLQQPQVTEPSTIPYTELPEDTSGGRIAKEWNLYRREVGRLLAEGQEGRWVLIKGGQIIGIWDSPDQAEQVRLEKFLFDDVLIHQVVREEPVFRGPTFFRQCHT